MAEIIQRFKIKLTRDVENKIIWLTKNYNKEISAWLGGEIKEGIIFVDDLLFPEQEVSGASVDTDTKQLIKLRKEYGDRCKRIIGHWHSHNTMTAHWSQIDDTFIDQYMHSRDLRVFFVSSVADGILARAELRNPIAISINKLEIESEEMNPELETEMKKVIEDKVKAKTVIIHVNESQSSPKVVINKQDWSVIIDDLPDKHADKLDGLYPYERVTDHFIDDTQRIVYKVGSKMAARELKKNLKTFISVIQGKKQTETQETLKNAEDDGFGSEEALDEEIEREFEERYGPIYGHRRVGRW